MSIFLIFSILYCYFGTGAKRDEVPGERRTELRALGISVIEWARVGVGRPEAKIVLYPLTDQED